MAVTAAFSIAPLGGSAVGADGSVAQAVAEVVRIVRDSGLANETNAMFTNVEGELGEVLGLIERCIEHMAGHAPRVSVVVKLDVRPGRADALHEKVAAVEQLLSAGEGSPIFSP
ncbi:MAG: thiamine-binding protein [Acidimicrobiales bacterium]